MDMNERVQLFATGNVGTSLQYNQQKLQPSQANNVLKQAGRSMDALSVKKLPDSPALVIITRSGTSAV